MVARSSIRYERVVIDTETAILLLGALGITTRKPDRPP